MENIVSILMKRDGITKREARSRFNSCKRLLFEAIANGNYSEAEDIIMSELGLEPDYIIDIIDSEINTPKSKGGKEMKKNDIVKTVPTLKPVANVLEKKAKKEDTTMKKTQPPKIKLTPTGKKIANEGKENTMKKTTETATVKTGTIVIGDSLYIPVNEGTDDEYIVSAILQRILKTSVIFNYIDIDDEELEVKVSNSKFKKYLATQDDLKAKYDAQEEELDDEGDDDIDWDEILEGVSVNNLRAICKKLKVPMSEIKGRSKDDLISIIIDSHDDEEIQKAYDSVGATTNEEEKKKPLSTGSDEGKKNKRYWENETPIESNTDGNIVNYYEEAGKLQIFGKYEKNGEFFKTKGVTIDVGVMSSKDAMQMISMMCYAMKDAVEDDRVKEIVEKLELINQEYNTEQYLFTKPEELAPFDEKTLERMALNCGCDLNAKRKGAIKRKAGATRKDDLIKMIIEKTTELNG